MAEGKNKTGNNLQEGSMFIPLDNSKDGDIALKEIRDVVVDNEKFFTEKGALITELKEGNKGLKETNDWLKNIYNSLTREKSVNTGGYSSIDPVLLGSIMTQKTAGFENVLENLQRSISPIFQKTNQNLEGLYRIGKEEGSDRRERKKLTKSQNENSFRFKDFIKEKGGFSRATLGLGASIIGSSVKTVAGIGKGLKNLGGRIISGFQKVMGSSLWEIIKTILFLLLFDPEGSFVKSIGKFMLRVVDKIWDSFPDWLKDVFANINVFLSRIVSKILWLGSYIVEAIAWVVSVIKNDAAAQGLRDSAERMRTESDSLDLRNQIFDTLKDTGLSAHKSLAIANEKRDNALKEIQASFNPAQLRAIWLNKEFTKAIGNALADYTSGVVRSSAAYAYLGKSGSAGDSRKDFRKRYSEVYGINKKSGKEQEFWSMEDWMYMYGFYSSGKSRKEAGFTQKDYDDFDKMLNNNRIQDNAGLGRSLQEIAKESEKMSDTKLYHIALQKGLQKEKKKLEELQAGINESIRDLYVESAKAVVEGKEYSGEKKTKEIVSLLRDSMNLTNKEANDVLKIINKRLEEANSLSKKHLEASKKVETPFRKIPSMRAAFVNLSAGVTNQRDWVK